MSDWSKKNYFVEEAKRQALYQLGCRPTVDNKKLTEMSLRVRLDEAKEIQAEVLDQIKHNRISPLLLKRIVRYQLILDVYTSAVAQLDMGRDVGLVLKDMIEDYSKHLLDNVYAPSSTCPYANAMNISRTDFIATLIRSWKQLLSNLNTGEQE